MRKKLVTIMLMIALAIPMIAPQNVNPSGVTTESSAKLFRSGITRKNYNMIKKGMDYEEVYFILGSKGKKVSEIDEDESPDGLCYETMVWKKKTKQFLIKITIVIREISVYSKKLDIEPLGW